MTNWLLPQFQLNIKFLALAIWRSTKMNMQHITMKSTFPKHPFSYNAKEAGIFISNSVQYHRGAERAHVLRALALLPRWCPENEIEGNRFLLSPAVGALSKCLLCYRDWVWASETQQLLFSCVWLSVTPWTVARQTLSMGFPRQEYWSGLPCPSPGDLPHPGIEPVSPALQADSLPLSHLGSLPETQTCQHKLNSLHIKARRNRSHTPRGGSCPGFTELSLGCSASSWNWVVLFLRGFMCLAKQFPLQNKAENKWGLDPKRTFLYLSLG